MHSTTRMGRVMLGSVSHAIFFTPKTFRMAFTRPKSLFSIHAQTMDTATMEVTKGRK